MYAIVENGLIVKTAKSLQVLFPNTSMPSVLNPNWMKEQNVQEVVEGERKDERFYWVTPGELIVVDGQATQTYVNTPKQLEDETVTPETVTYPNQTTVTTEVVNTASAEPVMDSGSAGPTNSIAINVEPVFVTSTELGDPVIVYGDPVTTKGLKSVWISQVKDTAGKMLASTDWMVIRKAERNIDIPASVVTKRAAIVAECDRLEAAITATTTVDELASVVMNQNWS